MTSSLALPLRSLKSSLRSLNGFSAAKLVRLSYKTCEVDLCQVYVLLFRLKKGVCLHKLRKFENLQEMM